MTLSWRAALLTPHGAAAIAVIGVRGSQAIELLGSRLILRRGKRLSHLEIGAVHVAEFLHGENLAAEEVVVSRLQADLLEIQCHGGRSAADSILRALASLGARIVSAKKWIHSEQPCPIKAAAHLALSKASAIEPARILADQMRGALTNELQAIIKLLKEENAEQANSELQVLRERSRVGLRLVSGFQVALVGKPNVGKSSLLNALLGYGRAIVFAEPGTTRDVLTAQAAFGGWPVTLHDLAGIRETNDPIEAEGVRRACELAANADLVLLVSDGSTAWTPDDDALCDRYPQALFVHNKCDLGSASGDRPFGTWVSSVTNEGLQAFEKAMLCRLIQPELGPGAAVPFELGQAQAISDAIVLLQAGDFTSARSKLLRIVSLNAYVESDEGA
jgi:tRNA modification GTPase